MFARQVCAGIGFCAAALVPAAAWAAEKAHVHGESRVEIAVEGNIVEIAVESPAHDIVGFETMPKTAAQRAAVARAIAALKNGEALFRLTPEAGCGLREAEVETPLAESGHAKAGHAKAGHAKSGHAEEEEHSEFHARYRFRCARPGRLKGVEAMLFDTFPAMREIEVNAILPGGQRAASLKPGARRFDF